MVTAFHGTKTIRFNCASAGALSIQIADLQDLICLTTAATVGYRLMDSVRIKKIEMWAAAAAAGNTALIIEEVMSSASFLLAAKSQAVQDMVVGTSRAAHVVYRPTVGTVQNNWFTSNITSATNILSITCPAGAVLDYTFEYTMVDGNGSPATIASAIAGATVGQVYCRPFGVGSSTTKFIPVGLASI
jgi:hypothetical protein